MSYISPIPAEVVAVYHVAGVPRGQRIRVHKFPAPDGRHHVCDPNSCRECFREAHWVEGQTHG